MHKYLCLDTETSGLFSYDKPADAEGQPRMAQIAMLYLNENFEVWGIENMLIKPDGWTMNDEAAKIHGLTQEILMERGYPVADALRAFNGALDDGRIIVGYNVSYDLKVLRGELRRAGLPDRFETTQSVDCMRKLTPVCKIAKANGKGYKWPKLTEAYKHVTGKELVGAHGALEDAHACREVFKWMVAQKMFTDAELIGVAEIR